MSDQQSLPPNYFYHQLPNGMEMVGQYMPSLSSITLGFQLDAAVINEPEDKAGLAHLFEYMLFQGTKQKDARALNEAFESLGILQEIRRRDDEPMSRIFDLVRASFFKGSAFARLSLGTTESVQKLQRRDLRDFWQARYRPNDVIFSIAGKFDWDHVVEQVQNLFGDWSGQADPSPTQHPAPTSDIVFEHQEGKQEHLGLMSPFPNYTDPDYYAAQVISEVLGGNMASRLFVEVREKRGLVYGVSAGLLSNKYMGALRIYAGTTPEQGHECLEVIVNELRKLEQDGITSDELDRAKVQLMSENVMRGEGSGARMGALATSWKYEHKLRTIQEVKEAIDAVTREQVLDVLHRFSPLNPLTVAAIGPLERDELVGNTL